MHKILLFAAIILILNGCGARLSDIQAGDRLVVEGLIGITYQKVRVKWTRPLPNTSTDGEKKQRPYRNTTVTLSEFNNLGADDPMIEDVYEFDGNKLILKHRINLDWIPVIP